MASLPSLTQYSGSISPGTRVLMTGDTVGGVFTFVQGLAASLEMQGCHVTLATFGPRPMTAPCLKRWYHHPSKLEWQQDPWNDIEDAGEWLQDLVTREQPDLLHFNTLCHGDLPWPVPLITTVHSCVRTWWVAVRNTSLPPDWNCYCQAVRKSLEAANLVTFPSHALRDSFLSTWNLNLPKSHVVPNGITRRPLLYGQKEPFAFAAGRFWDEAKNLRALGRASNGADWPIYIAGATYADKTHADSDCRPLGQLSPSQMQEWYARASIFLSPVVYEPFGLSILEAAAAGCALLLNDIPSLRENWSGAALFCPADEMGSYLNKLIRSPDLRCSLQQLALTRSRRFNQADAAARYMELYWHARSCACVS